MRHHAAPRETDDERARDVEIAERVEERVGVLLHREARRRLALAVTGTVDDDDATERGERLDLPAPHAAVEEEPVEEDDRRIAAACELRRVRRRRGGRAACARKA